MTFPEILQSLKSNGHPYIARELERKMIDDRLCGNDRIEEMYADVITENMYELDSEPLSPEYIVLSPEFAMLRSVASIMASYTPVIDIDLEADINEGPVILGELERF